MIEKLELMKRHKLYIVIDYIPKEGKLPDRLEHAAIMYDNKFIARTAVEIFQIRTELQRFDRGDENNRFLKIRQVESRSGSKAKVTVLEMKIPNTSESIQIGRSDAQTIHDILQSVMNLNMNIADFVRCTQQRTPKQWTAELQCAGELN